MSSAMSRPDKAEALNLELVQLAKKARLQGWNEFVQEVKVPTDLYAALLSNRPELVRLAPKRDMTAAEVTSLYELIYTLMETNEALRQHAQRVALLVKNWHQQFKGLATAGAQIERFANFKHNAIIGDLTARELEGVED